MCIRDSYCNVFVSAPGGGSNSTATSSAGIHVDEYIDGGIYTYVLYVLVLEAVGRSVKSVLGSSPWCPIRNPSAPPPAASCGPPGRLSRPAGGMFRYRAPDLLTGNTTKKKKKEKKMQLRYEI